MTIPTPQLNALATVAMPALTLSLGYLTAETSWRERRALYQHWRPKRPPAKQRWQTR